MKAGVHSMPEACSEASPTVQLVQIEVSPTHPLLLLKRALPWDTLTEVMTRHWRQHGKNVDGGPGWFCRKVRFLGKIQKSGIRNSMTYRLQNSRKSNFATEPNSQPLIG
jgi:hypothetical protein